MEKQKILVLGGTQFIGRNLVERLLQNSTYAVSLFNRGQTSPGLFPDLITYAGDRNTPDIELMGTHHWDIIIDVSCYFPDSLSRLLNSLRTAPKRYIFVSTCSVYDSSAYQGKERPEDAPRLICSPAQKKDTGSESYGARKAECERILEASGLEYLILRPALVYGPYDHTDRFYYWLDQVRAHDPLLLPEGGKRVLSLSYVKDVVEMIVQGIEMKPKRRIYNAVSFPQASILQIVETAALLLQKKPAYIPASSAFLEVEGIRPWVDMPLWLNSDDYTYSNQRLKADFDVELSLFEDTIEKSLSFYASQGFPLPQYGIKERQRQSLLPNLQGRP